MRFRICFHYVGNVMIDTLVYELAAARAMNVLAQFGVMPKSFAIATIHRPSNVDNADRLEAVLAFLADVAVRMPVILPLHPRTKARVAEFGLMQRLSRSRVRVADPIGYREMLALMDVARLVITDSGGIQEETTFLDVPCVTLRENTERPITVTNGTNTIVGSDFALARRTIDDIEQGRYKRATPINGWDGEAATRIATVLVQSWT
jgi:UDP-N-acetylglucosamine 2-epimerase (non-hydrolysing)